MGDGIWILFLEAGLALGLFVFIVWWTLPRRSAAVTPTDASNPDRDRNHHG